MIVLVCWFLKITRFLWIKKRKKNRIFTVLPFSKTFTLLHSYGDDLKKQANKKYFSSFNVKGSHLSLDTVYDTHIVIL